VLHKREELQSLHLRALFQTHARECSTKAVEVALAYGRRILSRIRTRETVQRAVMLLYVLNSQRAMRSVNSSAVRPRFGTECDGVADAADMLVIRAYPVGREFFEKLPQAAA